MIKTYYFKIIGGDRNGKFIYTVTFARYWKYIIDDERMTIDKLIQKIKNEVETEKENFHADWADYKMIDLQEYIEGMEGIVRYKDMDLETQFDNGEI